MQQKQHKSLWNRKFRLASKAALKDHFETEFQYSVSRRNLRKRIACGCLKSPCRFD